MLLDGYVKGKIDGFEKRLDRIIDVLELIAGVQLASQGRSPEEIMDIVHGKPKRRKR